MDRTMLVASIGVASYLPYVVDDTSFAFVYERWNYRLHFDCCGCVALCRTSQKQDNPTSVPMEVSLYYWGQNT